MYHDVPSAHQVLPCERVWTAGHAMEKDCSAPTEGLGVQDSDHVKHIGQNDVNIRTAKPDDLIDGACLKEGEIANQIPMRVLMELATITFDHRVPFCRVKNQISPKGPQPRLNSDLRL